MKTLVLSLGGSLIVPDNVDISFLESFIKEIRKHYKDTKFVIVCGGGSIARKYIEALVKEKASVYDQSQAGMRATRMNALLLMELFGKEANDTLPKDMTDVQNNLRKNKVVVCGALRFTPHSTSDGTAARLAKHIGADFINITDVAGLYTDNPKTNKNAKFIEHESWKDFEKRALAIKHKPGQHFVLDQEAATIIRQHKIKTLIVGKSPQNLSKAIKGKKFVGTEISG
jgi:uridylate kinase